MRRGLADHVVDRMIRSVEVTHPRAVRRHVPGAPDLIARLTGSRIAGAHRRGKFLWLTFQEHDDALMVHLGMSGQMLIRSSGTSRDKHAHIVADLGGTQLLFVDQRTFGGWWLAPLTEVDGSVVPESVAHISRDPFDPAFDPKAVAVRLRNRRSEIKRVLLDQTAGMSGIGNIYADESLWRAKIHPQQVADELSRPAVARVVEAAQVVMTEALAAGGTSFDSLYVNVNGSSGYFSRSLNAYGREGEPCGRCGASIIREKFTNRSSFYCPRCQRLR